MFRHTNTYHCGTTAYSIQYSNVLCGFAAEEQKAVATQLRTAVG